MNCHCLYCAQLNAFLADPAAEVGRIRAAENHRAHVLDMVGRHRCDLKHALERQGGPHTLVLTKTRGDYDRAVKRYTADQQLLRALPAASGLRSTKRPRPSK